MKRCLLAMIVLAAGVVRTVPTFAQTANYTPPMFTMTTSSNGLPPFTPLTSSSGIGSVQFTPPFFVPMCSATGAPPYSQCTFGGVGSGVSSIDSQTGAFTFSGSGVSHTGTAYTFSSGGGLTSFTTGNLAPLFTTALGSNPTTSPALAFTLTNAAQNAFFAGPATGGSGAPAYRSIVPADVPTLNQSTTGNAATATTASNATGINGAAVPASASGIAVDSSGHLLQQTSGNIASILGFQPIGPPNYTGDLATGVLAEYDFNTGSGTVLYDSSSANACSGAPCNGTLGVSPSTAPAWSGTSGITFGATDGISLPATLNGFKTVVIAGYFTPVTTVPQGTVTSIGYEPFITATTGSAGINLLNYGPCGGVNQNVWAPAIWNSSCTTISRNFGAGFHVWTFVLGTGSGNLDHVYIDGAEVPYSSGIQGSTAGAQTSGNLVLGTSNTGPWSSAGGTWTAYYARFYSGQLNAADIVLNTQIAKDVVQARGIATTPVALNIALPVMHFIGDSQTQGGLVTTPFPNLLSLNNGFSYAIYNWGIGGVNLQSLTASELFRVAPQCSTNFGTPSIAHILGGTNDWSTNGLSSSAGALAIFQNLMGEVNTLKRAGCVVFVSTMYNRYGTDPAGNTFGADQIAYNLLIRQYAKSVGYILDDQAANPLIGATGAAPNAGNTYWIAGGLHLNQTGTNLAAAEMNAAFNAYFGTTSANPTVLNASTYSMLTSDTYLLDSYTATSTVTLPDCLGQTGAVYTISNPTTFAVTIKNLVAAETINGVDHSTTGLALTAPGVNTFTDRALGGSGAGCVWDLK